MTQHLRNLLLTLMGVATLSAHADLNRTSATPVHVLLTLEDALFDGDEENHRSVILDLEWRHGVWGEVLGVARDYNMAFHRGSVISAS